MTKYICPKCEGELTDDHMAGPYYGNHGEDIYCSLCQYTAQEVDFKRATYGYQEQEKQDQLRSQVAEDKLYDHSLA